MQAAIPSQGPSSASPALTNSPRSRVKAKPNADKVSTTSTTVDPPRKVFLRRRRSRSSESRRKETAQPGPSLHSKKRKTSSTAERPPSSPVDPNVYPPGPSWRPKDHKRRSSEPHISVNDSRRIVSERGAYASGSDNENYETSHSTLPNTASSSRRHKSAKSSAPRSMSVERPHELNPTVEIAKKQISELKMSIEHSSKIISNQNQIIEKLKQDLAATKKINRKQAAQLEKLKESSKRDEEMLRVVQSNIQCQICLEPMTKPSALGPCGHVLCQSCLQEWFRSPISQGLDEEEDPRVPTLWRRKFCPCCRAEVFYRPLRIYTLSSIIAGVVPQPANPPPNPDSNADANEDPWKDIFLKEDSSFQGYGIGGVTEDDFDDDEEVEALYGDGWSLDIASSDDSDSDVSFGYGSDDDDLTYEGNYVRPPWAPPSLDQLTREDYPRQSDQDLRLLRRGATVAMIRLFRMTWDSSRGLVARTRESDIYLGWNIELEDDDEAGEEYMEGILNDIDYRPERWEVFTAPNGRLSAIMLMREDIAGTLEHAREIYNERRFNSSR